jgi:hypothetical protein
VKGDRKQALLAAAFGFMRDVQERLGQCLALVQYANDTGFRKPVAISSSVMDGIAVSARGSWQGSVAAAVATPLKSRIVAVSIPIFMPAS